LTALFIYMIDRTAIIFLKIQKSYNCTYLDIYQQFRCSIPSGCDIFGIVLARTQHTRKSKITQFYHAFGGDEDVFWLHISVNASKTVAIGNTLQDTFPFRSEGCFRNIRIPNVISSSVWRLPEDWPSLDA